jgi:hypothetical protein
MRVAFILLAHEKPAHLQPLLQGLLAAGADVYLHYDASSPHNLKDATATWGLDALPGHLYHAKRVRVTWGEWSIVQATLNCLYLARQQGYNADYFMLISGSCMPIKPISVLQSFLQERGDADYVEAVNAYEKHWVTDGIQTKHKIKRRLPLNHTPYMGSQWWCLRASTVDSVLKAIDRRPKILRFYRRTWVPDELFFQTMVGNLVPLDETSSEILTRYKFNSWGVPRVYFDDDYAELLADSAFFARKISHRASRLKGSLQALFSLLPGDFHKLVDGKDTELAVQLRGKFLLECELGALRWFSLAESLENEYDYIKSIPNPMLVIVSASPETRTAAIQALRAIPDFVVYGDILDGEQLEFGPESSAVAGYRPENVKLARHKWHYFLGELAFHAKGKALAFSLGRDPLRYLEILHWRQNLTVLVVDNDAGPQDASLRGKISDALQPLFVHSQVTHAVGKDSHCRFRRLSLAQFRKLVREAAADNRGPRRLIDSISFNNNWPSALRTAVDRYEFLKSIPNAMLVVYSTDESVARLAIEGLKSHAKHLALGDVFSCVPPLRENVDWHCYLGDLAYVAGRRTLAFILRPEHAFIIETLRWKKNLTVMLLEAELTSAVSESGGLSEILEAKRTRERYHEGLREMRALLSDRHCEVYDTQFWGPPVLDDVLERVLASPRLATLAS